MDIRAARIPEDILLVRELFQEYAAAPGVVVCLQGFADELATLPGSYRPPGGRLLLAFEAGEVAGCVALRPWDDESAELKRLYLRPSFRGRGLGRRLTERAIEEAAAAGYRRIVLDTLPAMAAAIVLYRSLGMVEVPPYGTNPVPSALFFAKELSDGSVS